MFKIIVKFVLAIAAVMAMGMTDSSGNPDVFGAITMFAVIYGLLTWYIYAFTHGSPIFAGTGLISMAYALILNLGLPLLVIIVPMFILEAILPGEIGAIIFGIIVLLVCAACVLADVVHIARMFNPGFLGSFGDIFERKPEE